MQEALSPTDAATRWEALRSSLLDPQTGVVKSLEQSVRWGLLAYDGPLPVDDSPATACPRFVLAEASLGNHALLDEVYPVAPLGGSTPTDRALQTLIEHLPATNGDDEGPTIVVLATDGQPNDFCTNVPAHDIKENVIANVKQLAAAGHSVYVISLAGDDAELSQHLSSVAQASGTGQSAFTPQATEQLRDTIRNLVGTPASCELLLAEEIVAGKECAAKVQLNGKALECNNPDGWRLKDANTIEVTGSACQAYKQEWPAVLHAEVPCEILAAP
jgi:hypothetical protein